MNSIATEVGTAYLSIVAATKGMTKDIRRAFGDAVGDGDVAGKQSGKGFLGGLGRVITKGAAILGVGALVGTTISAGMQRAISIEGSQKKLEGLGHSAASITSIMDSALKSVKGTAYGLGDAASVAAMMAAAGVENGDAMTRTLSTVADVAAISGRSLTDMGTIFGSVAARGKLQGDDMLQLMSSGIPVLQLLGTHLGKTSAEVSAMVSKGQIDFQTFADAMEKGMGGAAQKGAETFTGALANTRAALGRLGAAFLSPALQAAKPLLIGVTAVIDAMTSAVTPLADALAARMVPAAESVGSALSALAAGDLSGVFGGAVGPVAHLVSALSPLNIAFQALKPVLPQLADAFLQIVTALLPAVPALASVAAQLGGALAQAAISLVPVLVPIVVQLAELAGALLSNEPLLKAIVAGFVAFKTANVATGVVSGLLGGMRAATPVLSALSTGLRGIPWVTASGGAAQFALTIGQTLRNPLGAAQVALAGLRSGLLGAGSVVGTFASTVGGVLRGALSVAVTAARGLWVVLAANPIGATIAAVAALAAGLVWFFTQTDVGREAWATFTTWLADTWAGLVELATGAWAGLTEFFSGLWADISAGASAGWAAFTGVLSGAWAVIEPIVTVPLKVWSALFQATWDTITAAASAALLILTGLFTGNFDLIDQATSGFWATIDSIWSGAWATITGAASTAWATIVSLFTSAGARILGAVTKAWSEVSAAFTTGIARVVGFVVTLPGRVVAGLGSLAALLAGVASRAWTSFNQAVMTGIARAIGFVATLPGRARAALGNLGSLLVGVGRAMIQGLINGVVGMAGNLGKAISGLLGGAVSRAKAALGIHSPSRVFMELGGYTGEGFTIGLEAEVDGVAQAAAKVAAAAVPDVSFDPWDKALTDLSASVTPAPVFIEPPAYARTADPVGASEGVEALLLRLIGAVEAGQTINLDGRALVGATARNMSQTLSAAETGKGRAAGRGGLEV
ncbi:MAG: tape measure protein [Propionibacteriaceae bacterium]|nr:tape measure protein [Propionibacteriaceae bacterium]